MLLCQLVLTKQHRITLINQDDQLFYKVYDRRKKTFYRIGVNNSFYYLLAHKDKYFLSKESILKSFHNYADGEDFNWSMLNFAISSHLPVDLTETGREKILKSLKVYQKKLMKERGVSDV